MLVRFRRRHILETIRKYHKGDSNEQSSLKHQYDLVCIGGGSGGLAAAKRAHLELQSRDIQPKIAIVDYREHPNIVNTSPDRPEINWRWGLGGTCTNVGCIPKKIMHTAALYGEYVQNASEFGWKVPSTVEHDWESLVENVQNHIRSIHFGYRSDMMLNKIEHINARAKFLDKHTIEVTDAKGNVKTITSRRFIIAVGCMPKYPDIEGAKEYAITSDELFALIKPPNKTLVVGASYIALESAGYLSGLNQKVTVMMRSIPLRGFDQDCAQKIVEFMKERGTTFKQGCVPTKIRKNKNSFVVEYVDDKNSVHVEEYDTVLFAVGRKCVADELGLQQLGVKFDNDKIDVNEFEQTSVPHIYAVGDCINRGLELTPTAIHAGSLLSRRIYSEELVTKNHKHIMDYTNVPTTVFTPLEYGSCGMSEEDTIKKYGQDNIEVYLIGFTPLEHEFTHKDTNKTYMKVICVGSEEKIIGFHYLGPNAGEITQGVAVAIRLGVTKHDLDSTVGIHPTVAEEMTRLNITRRSGLVAEKRGC
ncbi:thioredoxin reductase (NADPH) [Acrasis kona]|uniref:thioredoxin-disulfide reductase (NADPH) n=1 Tax=Acrasis kona TaxID=1008807 RepID=A0AAW2Z030_9EUKA